MINPQLQLQRPPLIATIITLIAIAILCSLGNWQLQRLAWKEGLIASMKNSEITGHYLNVTPIKIIPRTHDGAIGAHLYSPFMIEDSQKIILINRGWVPQNWPDKSQDPFPNTLRQTLSGLFAAPPKANIFTPANNPEKGQWYHAYIKDIAAHYSLENIAKSVFIPKPSAQDPAIPLDPRANLRNDHKQYAIFWFTMAGVLIIIFGLRFILTKPKN